MVSGLSFRPQEVIFRQFDAHNNVIVEEKVNAQAALGRGLAYFQKHRVDEPSVWAIVHIPSGNILNWAAFERESSAKRYIELVAGLVDWTITSYKAVSNHIAESELFIHLAKAINEAAKA